MPATDSPDAASVQAMTGDQIADFRGRVSSRLGVDVEVVDDLLTATDPDALLNQAVQLADAVERSARTGPRPDLSQGARGERPSLGTPAEVFADFLRRAL